MGLLSHLEPAPVFHYFEEICKIPHGSGNTREISDYLAAFAREHGLWYVQDEANNVIIRKAGTAGYEGAAPVMLQGHIDMVCEKEEGCGIDFENDGLELRLADGVISARGTTLGGDDGIAVAYAMAILASTDIPHPPLEAVFTVDEEIGMLGATALDTSVLEARTMLNMDSEEEGYLLTSCAGGVTATAHLPVAWEEVMGARVTLAVAGLQGGHSGVEIDKGRANANRLLGRTLYELGKTFSFRIAGVDGGLKDNAIPRMAEAKLVFPAGAFEGADDDGMAGGAGRFRDAVAGLSGIYASEYRLTDPDVGLQVRVEGDAAPARVMTRDAANKVMAALVNLPDGIQRMSFDIRDLVQTSLNLGVLATKEEEVVFSFAVRSSVETEKQELVSRIQCLMGALGGSVTCRGGYPAWEYRQDSPLRDLMVRVYEEKNGRKPIVQALHAGLECGLFAGKIPGLDCISFGPDMKGVHTPKESLDVESVGRTWDYLLEVLKRMG